MACRALALAKAGNFVHAQETRTPAGSYLLLFTSYFLLLASGPLFLRHARNARASDYQTKSQEFRTALIQPSSLPVFSQLHRSATVRSTDRGQGARERSSAT